MKATNFSSIITRLRGLSEETESAVRSAFAEGGGGVDALSESQLREALEALALREGVSVDLVSFFAGAELLQSVADVLPIYKSASDFYIVDDPVVRVLTDPEAIYSVVNFILSKKIGLRTVETYVGCLRCMGGERPFEYVARKSLSYSRFKTCRAAYARKTAEDICSLWQSWESSGDEFVRRKLWGEVVSKTFDIVYIWNRAVRNFQDCKGGLSFGRGGGNSKRKILKDLPVDWRCCMVVGALREDDRFLLSIMAVTGCRPSEVCGKVLVMPSGEGEDFFKFYIVGSKTSEATTGGQPLREILVDVSCIPAAAKVIKEKMIGKSWFLSPDIDSENFGRRVSRLANKIGFKGGCAYCFRHQFAADLKSARLLPSEVISAAMGHVSGESKNFYGHWRNGKISSGGLVVEVRASRDVRSKKSDWLERLISSTLSNPEPDYP